MPFKILFVDDDVNIISSFKAMMHGVRKEWNCRYVTDARDALKLLEKVKFDIVIADMRMPHMDGAELLKEVAEIQPDSVRVILSGYSNMQALIKSAKHAHQFISKPCNSECLIRTIRRLMDIRHVLTNDSVRSMVTRLDALPALPDLYIAISEELNKPTPNLQKIGELVAKDPGISATLMKVVNSSFFGFYETVSSPSRAAVLLGTDILKGLILGVHFLQEIDTSVLGSYSVEKLWDHCLQTGYFAKAIGAAMSDADDFITDCFISGLLHDIGKLIFVTMMTDEYRTVLEFVGENGGPVVDSEQERLQLTHAEVGAYLLGLWGFNENVVTGVYCHHSLDVCTGRFGTAHAVHVADVLQHELGERNPRYTFSGLNTDKLASAGLAQHLDGWRGICLEMMEAHIAE